MTARSTDVLVIGAGLAGFCASLEALAAGREVMLLEKQDSVGGSTMLSGGAMAFAGTEEQTRAGIGDSGDRLRDDLLRVGEHRNDPALVDAYVAAQVETYRWLRENAPLYRNERLDFWALSRFQDVLAGLIDWKAYTQTPAPYPPSPPAPKSCEYTLFPKKSELTMVA